MTVPLVILAVLAVVAGWNVPCTSFGLAAAVGAGPAGGHRRRRRRRLLWPTSTMPAEHSRTHASDQRHGRRGSAFAVALVGLRAGHGVLRRCGSSIRTTSGGRSRRSTGSSCTSGASTNCIALLFVRPVLRISGWVAAIDKHGIDWLADNSARLVEARRAARRLDRPHVRRRLGRI